MTYEEVDRLIGLPEQPLNVKIAIYELEARGYRFCVDFGYENAVDKLVELELCVSLPVEFDRNVIN